MQRVPRLVELLLAVALCALIAFWVVRVSRGDLLAVPPTAAPAGAGAPGRTEAVLASARLFGSRPPGALSDNVRPLGVVADSRGGGSVIVSVDGQPPKVYRVGDTLDGRLVAAIRPDQIELESGGARQVFRLPVAASGAAGLTIVGTGASSGTATIGTPAELPPAPSPMAQGGEAGMPARGPMVPAGVGSPYGPPPDTALQVAPRRGAFAPRDLGGPPADNTR